MGKSQRERMKEELNLTDEQSAKLDESRKSDGRKNEDYQRRQITN